MHSYWAEGIVVSQVRMSGMLQCHHYTGENTQDKQRWCDQGGDNRGLEEESNNNVGEKKQGTKESKRGKGVKSKRWVQGGHAAEALFASFTWLEVVPRLGGRFTGCYSSVLGVHPGCTATFAWGAGGSMGRAGLALGWGWLGCARATVRFLNSSSRHLCV